MYTSVVTFHPLEIAKMIQEMSTRIHYQNQYIETVVEESDDGRIDLIAKRIYGDLSLMWVVAKFASVSSLQTRLKAGSVIRLPSLANVAKALQRERTEQIPVFEYLHSPEELATLLQSQSDKAEVGAIGSTVFEVEVKDPVVMGQPLAMGADGWAVLAANDGINYKVLGLAVQHSEGGETVKYVTQGELSIGNWADIRDDGDASKPDTNQILWLSASVAGKLTVAAPNVAGTYAVRIGTMRAGNTIYVDIGDPLGI